MSAFNLRKLGIGIAVFGLVGALFAGCGHWGGRHGHWGHHRHGLDNPEEAREHVEDAAEWILNRVDASDQQNQQVKSIVGESVDGFVELAQQHRQHREDFITEFSRPSIDRQALEQIRRAEMEVAEAASSQMVRTLADVAEVLNPEQRRELLERFQRFHR